MKIKISRYGYALLALLIVITFLVLTSMYLTSDIIAPPCLKNEPEVVIVTQIEERTFIPDIEVVSYPRVEVYSSLEATEQLEFSNERKMMIEQIIYNFNSLGYSEDRINVWGEAALGAINSDIEYYQSQFDYWANEEDLELWAARMEEYPTATTIWLFLKEQGYNDYVAAGILGNMMTEAGWQTLAISPYASSGSYYGICQWGPHFPGRYTDLNGQLQLLVNTIEEEFQWYGSISYEEFCALEDERQAALAFARSYERCTSASYSQRQTNATTALEYFI